MINALPDRRLRESEVDKLRESDRFDDIYIRGRALNIGPGVVEEIVITLPDGSEKEISYFHDTGWEVLEPINSEPGTSDNPEDVDD